MAILKANGKILKANGKILKANGGSVEDPIPLVGTLTNKFIFTPNNPTPLIDVIGGVHCKDILNPLSEPISEKGLNVSYTHGVNLNVACNVNDYIECIFSLGEIVESYLHIRPLNLSNGIAISDTRAFVIWRGGYNYWTSYFAESGGWKNSFSENYNIFNGKKIGLYIKANGYIDIYIDNVLVRANHKVDYMGSLNFSYALGVTVTNYTATTEIYCSRVRLFRNCVNP